MTRYRTEPFAPWHLAAIDVQPGQPELGEHRLERGAALSATGRCFTLLDGERVLFCGGALSTHENYATLWSAVARDAGAAMLAIERRVRRFIATLDERRVDTTVRAGFAPARRWIERLGFTREAMLRDYFEDGEAAVVYRLKRAWR